LSQFSSEQNKDNIPSGISIDFSFKITCFYSINLLSNIIDEEVEIPYSSPSATVLETVDGISLRIPEQLGEDWMETSDDGNVVVHNYNEETFCIGVLNPITFICEMQGKENDVLCKATKLPFTQNTNCNAAQSGII